MTGNVYNIVNPPNTPQVVPAPDVPTMAQPWHNNIGSHAQNLWNNATTALNNGVDTFQHGIQGVGQSINERLGNPWNTLGDTARGVWDQGVQTTQGFGQSLLSNITRSSTPSKSFTLADAQSRSYLIEQLGFNLNFLQDADNQITEFITGTGSSSVTNFQGVRKPLRSPSPLTLSSWVEPAVAGKKVNTAAIFLNRLSQVISALQLSGPEGIVSMYIQDAEQGLIPRDRIPTLQQAEELYSRFPVNLDLIQEWFAQKQPVIEGVNRLFAGAKKLQEESNESLGNGTAFATGPKEGGANR